MSTINGYKTYIVCAAAIVYAILGMTLGYMDSVAGMQLIFGALAAAGLRHGIAVQP